MATTELLDTALAIGRRLARQALWEGAACTWDVLEPLRDPASRVRTVRAEGQLDLVGVCRPEWVSARSRVDGGRGTA